MSSLLYVLFCVLLCCGCLQTTLAHENDKQHGMMIDAGSGGSRLHIFSWDERVFKHFPFPLTIPENNQIFTTRLHPGVETFVQLGEVSNEDKDLSPSGSDHFPHTKKTKMKQKHLPPLVDEAGLRDHLAFLLTFAKNQLLQFEESWSTFPIFFRASGGVRALPPASRSHLLDSVRGLLDNRSFCPFRFQPAQGEGLGEGRGGARVLSGDEEAAFAWAAANFLHGRLSPPSSPSHSPPVAPLPLFDGVLDLGAASSQLALSPRPDQGISDELFRLQLGMHQHWNLYAKSFLQFGYNSARLRHLQELAQQTVDLLNHPAQDAVVPRALDYCFFAGYSEGVQVNLAAEEMGKTSEEKHNQKGGYKKGGSQVSVEVHGPAVPAGDQLQRCMESLRGLLRAGEENNAFCNEAYHGECSMDGTYQPPLPPGGHFVGTSTYQYPWQFLQMPTVGTLPQFKQAAADMCSKSFNDIVLYDATLTYIKTPKHSSLLPYYCFLSSYIVVLLEDGYGFTGNHTLSAQPEVKGNKVSWAYGAMLYEVNALPFRLVEPDEVRLLGRLLLAWSCGVVAGVIVVGGILSQFLYRPHQRPTDAGAGEQSTAAPAASSFYHDLAKIYHGSSGTGGSHKTDSSAQKISQYSPFTNPPAGDKNGRGGDLESSALLGAHRRGGSSYGAGSVDSNASSADTVSIVKTDSNKNQSNTYRNI